MMSTTHIAQKLAEQLAQKEAQLDFAYSCLSTFTHVISHDINSPISTLKQLLEMLHESHYEHLDEHGQEVLDMTLLSATRAHDLSTGLLTYSQQCRPSNVRETVDTALVISDVVSSYEGQIQKQNITVNVGEMPPIISNADALTNLFSQFLDNALKFNPSDNQHRTINIRCEQHEQHAEFQFEDQGIGVAPQRVEKLFKPMGRLVTRAEYAGAGLGLALCTIIAHALKGSLWVTPGTSGGSIFHVRLPNLEASTSEIQR